MPMRQPAIPRTNSACRISRLGALKLSASLRSMSSGDLRRRSNIAESEVRLQIFQRLSVRLRVGIDEVVERIALLIGRETDVAAVGEENAVDVVRAEEEVALGGVLPGLRSGHWNPADSG